MSPRGAQRWDEIDPSSPLGRLVAPHRWITDGCDDGMGDPYETALDAHLLGNGLIQLANPGFDEHFVGIGLMPWYGFGHCALLAWHLHRLTGWQLTSLVDDGDCKVHTGVRTPDGRILDWTGVSTATDCADEYRSMKLYIPITWIEETPEQWIARWLPCGDPTAIEVGGHDHPAHLYDEFELTLTDHLARLLAASVDAPLLQTVSA